MPALTSPGPRLHPVAPLFPWAPHPRGLFQAQLHHSKVRKTFSLEERESEVTQLCLTLFDPMGSSLYQAPLSMRFSRQEYWSRLPFPSPGTLPDPGIEPRFPALQADSLPSEPLGNQILNFKILQFFSLTIAAVTNSAYIFCLFTLSSSVSPHLMGVPLEQGYFPHQSRHCTAEFLSPRTISDTSKLSIKIFNE